MNEIEIFSTGSYAAQNGREVAFTEADLDAIVANYAALAEYLRPPLKAGHSTSQILANQTDGDPALGWVAGLQRRGSKLVATVADMPAVVRDAIAAGRYRRVSAELLLDWGKTAWERNLKTGVTGPVLEGVALLGADLPQVANLADLQTYLTAEPGPDVERVAATRPLAEALALSVPNSPARRADVENTTAEESTMAEDIAALKATVDAQAAELAALKVTAEERLTAESAERARLSAEVERLRVEADAIKRERDAALHRQAELDALAFADQYAGGEHMRVLPAQRAWLAALHRHLARQGGDVVLSAVESERLQCTESGKGADLTALGLLEAFLQAGPDHTVLLTAMPRPAAERVADDYDTVIAAIAQREKLNLSIPSQRAKAASVLASERPDLTGARRVAA